MNRPPSPLSLSPYVPVSLSPYVPMSLSPYVPQSLFSLCPYVFHPDHAHHPPCMSPRRPVREEQIRMAARTPARGADRRRLDSRIH